MKFLVDAQLPRSLANFLRERGFDAVHTLELADRNRTNDRMIIEISLAEERVVISKDSDFYDSYRAKQEPFKLLYLTMGNIHNRDLLQIVETNLLLIIHSLQNGSVIEMNRTSVITIL
jgi:predicted nuclease of predicted toxin-antitoxin system